MAAPNPLSLQITDFEKLSVVPSPSVFRPNTPSQWSDDDVQFEDGRRVTRQQIESSLLLFFCEEQRALAELIATKSRGQVVLGEVSWGRFPDSFPDLRVVNSSAIRWTRVAFLASFHAPEVIFEQLSVIYSLPKFLAHSVKIILPYFPTATMERVQVKGEIATAHTLARMLSCIPLSARGPVQICIFDIHTLANQFYFGDQVLIRLHTCINLLLKEFKRLQLGPKSLCIAFPDAGAQKRFQELFQGFNFVTCHKARSPDNPNARDIVIQEGDPKGKRVVIVDDLVQSGGTLLNCADALYDAGAKEVSCYVTHAVFPKESWKKFLPGNRPGSKSIVNFWVMDTVPVTVEKIRNKEPFRVLSCAALVFHLLMGD